MALDLECQQKLVENFCQEEDQKAGKDFQLELNNDKAWKFKKKLTFWNSIKT